MNRFYFLLIVACLVMMGSIAAFADDPGFHETFPHLDRGRWFISNGWANGDHQSCEWRAEAIMIGGNNLRMTLSDHGGKVRPIGCAELKTNAKQSYGLYEARMRSAAGSGLNTAFFTYVGPPTGSKEHDEIDFEFLGKNSHTVDINYFTNGKPQLGKSIPLDFDASQSFHNYAFDWEPNKISWYIDGKLIYETPAEATLPHNPSQLFLSLWSGAKGEDAWMGHFDYSQPVTADVEWAAYTPSGAPCAFPESMKCKK